MPVNVEQSIYRGIKNVNYTSKLEINEPSTSNPTPIYRVLNITGDIVIEDNSVIVSIKHIQD